MADARLLAALRALGETALRVGRQTKSMEVVLGGLHPLVDPAWIDARYREQAMAELTAAHEKATQPLSAKDVEKVLKEAWGAKPSSELDAFDTEPVAVTPSAQVHRGEADGKAVAIKVLRPGLPESTRSDLGIAETLLRPLGLALPRVDPGAIMAEVRERALDELDLEHEGSVQRAFARALRRHPTLLVPGVIGGLTHERVLVTEWVEGTPVLETTGEARVLAAEGLIRFHAGSLRFGTVHADPHPGNALMTKDGRLAIIDFGASRSVDPARLGPGLTALGALRDPDPKTLGAALAELGWIDAKDGPAVQALAEAVLGPLTSGPASLDAAAVHALGDRLYGRREDVLALVPKARVVAQDLWPLRMIGQLFGLVARLEVPERDWHASFAAAVRDGFDA